MAAHMEIQEEAIPRRVLRNREDPLDMLTDQQLIANYRFDRRSILELSDRLQLEHRIPTAPDSTAFYRCPPNEGKNGPKI